MHTDPIGNVWPNERAARAAWAQGEREQNRRRAAMGRPAFTVDGPMIEPVAEPRPIDMASLDAAIVLLDAVDRAMHGPKGAAA